MKSYLAIFFISAACHLHSQQTTFNHRYHFDTPAAYLTSIVATDTCYYATGIYGDTFPWLQVGSLFVKINLDGAMDSVSKLIHPYKSYETRMNTLTPLDDGTFVVTAYSYDPKMKGMLIKYNQFGDTIWTREYLNPFFPAQNFMFPRGIAPLENGGFAIPCWVQKSPGNSEIYLVITDSLGILQSGHIYGNIVRDIPRSIAVTPNGELIVGGTRSDEALVTHNFTIRDQIFQVDVDGNTLWTYLSPISQGLRYGAADMVLLEDGSLVVASGIGHELYHPSVSLMRYDKYIYKLNPAREIEWEVTFREPVRTGSAFLTNIIAVSDGSGFVAAGTHGESFPAQNAFSLRGWIGKVSPQGDSLWTRQYVGLDQLNTWQEIYDIKETPDGGFILCGESRNSGALAPGEIRQQAWLLKLDQHGCLVPGCHITTSAEEPAPQRLRMAIYPNPTADYLNFYLRAPAEAAASELSFRIFNQEGRLMREFPHAIPGATYIVEVWDWPAETYVLQCLSGGRVLGAEQFVKR